MSSGSRTIGRVHADMVDRIRGEMAAARMTQSALARRSGIPETTLSKILNSQSALDVEQAGAIAGAFGLALWELVVPRHALHAARRVVARPATRRQPRSA